MGWPRSPMISRAAPRSAAVEPACPPVWVQTGDPATSGRAGYWLGTDLLGRDLLSRVMYGARVSLAAGFLPMLLTVTIGLGVGLTAGYLGGQVDTLMMRLIDVLYAFPDFLFVLILVSIFRPQPFGALLSGLLLMLVAFALTGWIGVARLVRAQVLVLKEQGFVLAARVIGVPTWRILLAHLLPNLLRPLDRLWHLRHPRLHRYGNHAGVLRAGGAVVVPNLGRDDRRWAA
jgi:oligopeptide transport system permease protein